MRKPLSHCAAAVTLSAGITKSLIAIALISLGLLCASEGAAQADDNVNAACEALLHQPTTAFDGPNQAVQQLMRNGMNPDLAEAVVGGLITAGTNDPAGWRPSQTCFDLWHQGLIK
jgi:hypothetical protein